MSNIRKQAQKRQLCLAELVRERRQEGNQRQGRQRGLRATTDTDTHSEHTQNLQNPHHDETALLFVFLFTDFSFLEKTNIP